jgi:MFS family permease
VLTNPVRLLAALPPPARLLVIGTFVNKLGTFILPYLTLVLQREFRLQPAQVGLLMAAQGVGSLAAILTGGLLTDGLGRRVTLMLSLFGSGMLAIGMGLPRRSPSSCRSWWASASWPTSTGRRPRPADGLTTVLFGAIVYRFIQETRPARVPAEAGTPVAASPWRDGVFLQLAATSFAFSMALYSFLTVLPLTITLSAGYPAAVYGALMGINGVAIAAFEMSIVNALRRFRRLRVAAVGLAVTGLGFALTGAVMHWAWFLLTILVWTAGEILTGPQQTAFVADWAPADARGRYLSVYQATWSLSVIVNPLVLLPLHARLPEAAFWPLLALITVPSAWLLFRLDHTADRKERLRGLAATGASA